LSNFAWINPEDRLSGESIKQQASKQESTVAENSDHCGDTEESSPIARKILGFRYFKKKTEGLIEDAARRYPELKTFGDRLLANCASAKISAEDARVRLLEDLIKPLDDITKATAKEKNVNYDELVKSASEYAIARHTLDLSRIRESSLLSALKLTTLEEMIAKDLAVLTKDESVDVERSVDNINAMEIRLEKAMNEGREFVLSKTTVTRQVTELAQIVDHIITTITPLQKDGFDRTLTAGRIKEVNDDMLRLAADSIRIGDPYLMLNAVKRYTETVESMVNLLKASERLKKAQFDLNEWKNIQTAPPRSINENMYIEWKSLLPSRMSMEEALTITDEFGVRNDVVMIANEYVKAFRLIRSQAVKYNLIDSGLVAELDVLFPNYVPISTKDRIEPVFDFSFPPFQRLFREACEGIIEKNMTQLLMQTVDYFCSNLCGSTIFISAYNYMIMEEKLVPESMRLFETVKAPGKFVMNARTFGTTKYFRCRHSDINRYIFKAAGFH
jgi:hypothetical protein